MAETTANIRIKADVQQAQSAIKKLIAQINAFNLAINKTNPKQLGGIQAISNQLLNTVSNTRTLTGEFEKLRSSATILDKTLSRGKTTLGEFFSASFNKNGTQATRVMELAREQAKILSNQYITTGKNGKGFHEVLTIGANGLDKFSQRAAEATLKTQIMNQMFRQGTTHMINFGKNTQWAGRQLMVGFTVPLTIFGMTAGRVFMELEQQMVYFKRVYGDVFTTTAETEKNLSSILDLAKGFTKYGIAVKDTLGLAGQVAAAGRQDVELREAVIQATRLATLGQMEQNTALKATIALQSAFKIGGQELAGTIDFLNAVENQTVVSLEDISTAIPRVAPVIQGLGGDVKDLTVFLAAMQEGGVSAEQGANALKSGLASLINPTKAASETLSGFNINLDEIILKNKGDLMGTVMAFGKALQGLDMFSRQQALEKVFGKYQYARLGALFENIGREGSQAAQVMELMGYSTSQLASLSDRELKRIEEAYGTKLKAAIEEFKLSLAPLGKMFIQIATPFIKFGTRMLEIFNNLPDGVKKFLAIGGVIVGVIIPAFLMFTGLLANLFGQLARIGQGLVLFGKGMAKGGIKEALLSIGSAAKYVSLEEMKTVDAENKLAISTQSATKELRLQATALGLVNTELTKVISSLNIMRSMQGGMVKAFPGASGKSQLDKAQTAANKVGKLKFASGGKVPGSGNQDTIPALLTPGEFVINKDASTKYAPFLAQINEGSVGQFADGFTPSKSDIKRGFAMEQSGKGRVQYRNLKTGLYVSEAVAVKAAALKQKADAKLIKETNTTSNKMAGLSGKLSLASGAVASVAMMSSILSGGQNEFANKLMMGGMAVSMLSSMIVGMKSGIAVAAVAVVGSLYMIHKSNQDQVKKGVELGNAMSMTAKSIKDLGSYFGTKSNFEKYQKTLSGETPQMSKMLTEGKNFLESDQGKQFLVEVQKIRTSVKGNSEKTRDLVASKLAQAVATGIMTQDQAQSIAYALGEKLKNMSLGIDIAAQMTGIVGPDGENLTKDPYSLAITLQVNSQKQVDIALNRVNLLKGELGKISELWSGQADEAKRAIGELQVFHVASLESLKQSIALVSLTYDDLINKAKLAGDAAEAARLKSEKEAKVEDLKGRQTKLKQSMLSQFLPDKKQAQEAAVAFEIGIRTAEGQLANEKIRLMYEKKGSAAYEERIKQIDELNKRIKDQKYLFENASRFSLNFNAVQKESYDGLRNVVSEQYKDDPAGKLLLNVTEDKNLANANLLVSVATEFIDPTTATFIAEAFKNDQATFSKIFNINYQIHGEENSLALGLLYSNLDEEQRKTFSIYYETQGAEEINRVVPLLTQVSQVPQLTNIVLQINTRGMTDQQIQDYADGLNTINQFPEVVGKEVIVKGVTQEDILDIDKMHDELKALGTVDEKYDYIVNTGVFGVEDLALFKQMWDAISKDPNKVASFVANFSTGGSELQDLDNKIKALEKDGVTYDEAERLEVLRDEVRDIKQALFGAFKVSSDTSTTTKEDDLPERKVSALEYLKSLLELKMKGLDPAAAAQLEQLEAVQLSEQAIGKQIKSINKLNEEQRIAAMTTEVLKDETQRLGDSLTISSSLIDAQIKMLDRNSIKPVQDQIDSYQKSLEKISKKEDDVNKRYDNRVKALDAVQRANERIANQQKQQIDLAGALTSGDFGAAAKAASEMTATSAGYQLEDAKLALEEQKQVDINNITEEINGKLLTRVQIQDQINLQQEKLVQLEKEKTALSEKQFKIQTLSQLMTVTGQIRNTANKTQRDMLVTQAQAMGTTLGVSDIQASGAFGGLSKELGIDLSALSIEITSAVQTSQKSIEELSGHTKSVADSFKLSASIFKKAETEASNSLSFMTGISALWGDRGTGLVAAGADIYASVISAKDAIKLGISDINNAKDNAINAITAASRPKKQMTGGVVGYMTGGMVNYKGSKEPAPGMMMGGRMKKYAIGSEVPGVGLTDKVPALLTPGEFVIRKSVAQANLPMLEALNGNIFPNMSSTEDSNLVPVSSTSNISNVNAPVYNYSVNVNVADTNSSPNEIADVVMNKIRMTKDRSVRGNRY